MKTSVPKSTRFFIFLFLACLGSSMNAQEVTWLSWSEASELATTEVNPKKI